MKIEEIISENKLFEMILRTASGNQIPDDTVVVAHKENIWVVTPEYWKENKEQVTQEISKSLGFPEGKIRPGYTPASLEDQLDNYKDAIVFSMYDGNLLYSRSHYTQSPQTSPLFKKTVQFLLNKFVITKDQIHPFSMGIQQKGFTNDEYDHSTVRGELPTVGYHGTNIDALASILKKGIISQSSGNYGDVHTKGYIFFTADDSAITQSYATNTTGGVWSPTSIPVIVHFKIPDQTKIKPDVDVAHDLYGKDSANINPDYKHLDFKDKEDYYRNTTPMKRPQNAWKHGEMFGYKGRIPPSHIIGISMPKQYGGSNMKIKQAIENIKAWNVLKKKYDTADINDASLKISWTGANAERIIDMISYTIERNKNKDKNK